MNDNGYAGGVNPYDAATLALFSGGGGCGGIGVGGRGGLCYGNDVLAANAHADGTAVKEGIDCNAKMCAAGLDRISDQAEESRRSSQFTSITDNMFRAELRGGDRLRDVEREMNANARVAAQCCCDTQKAIAEAAKEAALCCCDAKLEACKNTNDILKAIADQTAVTLAVESRNIERSLNAANAELTALKTQIACGCCPPCGR